MKKTVLTLLAIGVFTVGASAQILTSLGSGNLTIQGGSAPYSQSATSLTFNTSLIFGDNVYGSFSDTFDWSAYYSFGITFSVTGTNPNFPATVTFYDPGFNVINTYSFSTAGVGSSPSTVALVLDTPGTGVLSQVTGFQLDWGDSGSINATFTNVSAVPEPATWALLAGSLTTVMIFRRRRSKF